LDIDHDRCGEPMLFEDRRSIEADRDHKRRLRCTTDGTQAPRSTLRCVQTSSKSGIVPTGDSNSRNASPRSYHILTQASQIAESPRGAPTHLAIACPRCGRPAPANLAAPDVLRCAACGFFGAPPPEIGQRLHAARGLLFSLDVRLRQLSHAQRRAIEGAAQLRLLYFILSSIIAVPLALWALFALAAVVSSDDPTDDYGVAAYVLAVAPLLVFGALTALGHRYIRRKQRALEDACAARPPRERGEPAGCHVCGAPLAPGSGIARCSFCHADNLVEAGALSRLSRGHFVGADAIEQTITREARSATTVAGLTSALLLPAAIAAPILVVFWIFIVSFVLHFIKLEPSMKFRYVTVSTPAGQCIARLRRQEHKPTFDFGIQRPEGVPEKQPVPDGASLDPLDIKALYGRTVRMTSGKPGRIVRGYRTPGISPDNDIEIEPLEGGDSESRIAMGVCLAEPAAAPSPAPEK
jgi:hypothetical protein